MDHHPYSIGVCMETVWCQYPHSIGFCMNNCMGLLSIPCRVLCGYYDYLIASDQRYTNKFTPTKRNWFALDIYYLMDIYLIHYLMDLYLIHHLMDMYIIHHLMDIFLIHYLMNLYLIYDLMDLGHIHYLMYLRPSCVGI